MSLSSITATFAGTATFYANAGVTSQWGYSLDGTNFTLIGTPTAVTSTTLSNVNFDLASVSALQNLAASTTVTFRYFASGQTSTGGWGFTSSSATTGGLIVNGTIADVVVVPSGVYSYWDTNGTTGGVGGGGTWTSSSTSFATAVAGTDQGARAAVTDPVIFAGTAGTVTVSGAVQANGGITFGTTGYALSGGSVGLGGTTNTITTDTSVTSTVGSVITGSTGMIKAGAGTLILTGANTYTGNTTVSTGLLQIGDGTTTGSIGGDVINSSAISFNRSNEYTFSGVISGTGTLTQVGTGTTILTGANSYSGATTISAGVLQVGNGGTTGTLGSNNVTNNGTLAFDRSDTTTVANAISGTGAVTLMGSGTTILTGANSYTGITTISAGTLQIGSGATAGTLGSSGVTNNGTLAFNRSNSMTVANAISGTGSVVQSGSGITILTGSNSYGATTISAGTLQVGSGGTTGSLGSGAVVNNAGLAFNRSDAVTVSNAISGSGTVLQSGAGVTTFTGANSYLGGTTIDAGGIKLVGSGSLGSGDVTTKGSLMAGTGVTVSNDITVNGLPGGFALISGYDFQTTANGGTAAAVAPGSPLVYTANFGTGSLYLNGTNGSSAWTSLSSNPQVTSFAGTASVNTGAGFATATANGALAIANSSANGNSMVFTLNMTDLSGLTVSYATQGTASGFTSQTWQWSTNGTDWTTFDTVSSIPTGFALQTLDTLSALDDVATAYIRLTVAGASSASGNNRLDNIQFNVATQAISTAVLGGDTAGVSIFSGNITLNAGVSLTAASEGTSQFTGNMSGVGGVSKIGTGTVTLGEGSVNTYGGATTVSSGKLVINGDNSAATGAVTVQSGATLAGSGIVGGATTIEAGGTHAVGNSPGLQTFSSSLTYEEGSTFEWELGSESVGVRGTNYDAVDVAGALAVNNAIFKVIVTGLDIAGSFWNTSHTWDVFTSGDTITGDFASFVLYDSTDLVNAVDFTGQGDFSFTPAGGLQWSAEAVPEPTNALAGLLIGAGLLSRRRNRSTASK